MSVCVEHMYRGSRGVSLETTGFTSHSKILGTSCKQGKDLRLTAALHTALRLPRHVCKVTDHPRDPGIPLWLVCGLQVC